ncbi:hypothetical protein EDD29_0153 [Actinocorallia herbida]|uniref:Uncharacterized protein n=1 Tax=Actinocorallia herbida TaxID=58109 RepID=A0A3N1CMJ1_9ACTN|nr:hypothetical protein [Actinocorallia herbida]ROO82531.1 hypothetical protein EDD29_0011 [Actinocorallia herbida]ROO82672.1 hypothetical protein EDD29_0153 [Actinocorallia herbida]
MDFTPASPAPSALSSISAHWERKVSQLEAQNLQLRMEVAGLQAADDVRREEYVRIVGEHGQPPVEFTAALGRTGVGPGPRAAWVPLDRTGIYTTVLILPWQPIVDPYVIADLWAQVRGTPPKRVAEVPRDGICSSIEPLRLPQPLMAYTHLIAPLPHVVVDCEIEPDARKFAVLCLRDMWERHNRALKTG